MGRKTIRIRIERGPKKYILLCTTFSHESSCDGRNAISLSDVHETSILGDKIVEINGVPMDGMNRKQVPIHNILIPKGTLFTIRPECRSCAAQIYRKHLNSQLIELKKKKKKKKIELILDKKIQNF